MSEMVSRHTYVAAFDVSFIEGDRRCERRFVASLDDLPKLGVSFEKAKFKVGDRMRFPYGRKVGTITHVGSQTMTAKDGSLLWLGHLYQVTTYTLVEAQLRRVRKRQRSGR